MTSDPREDDGTGPHQDLDDTVGDAQIVHAYRVRHYVAGPRPPGRVAQGERTLRMRTPDRELGSSFCVPRDPDLGHPDPLGLGTLRPALLASFNGRLS